MKQFKPTRIHIMLLPRCSKEIRHDWHVTKRKVMQRRRQRFPNDLSIMIRDAMTSNNQHRKHDTMAHHTRQNRFHQQRYPAPSDVLYDFVLDRPLLQDTMKVYGARYQVEVAESLPFGLPAANRR
jgi:hypothetical protein